MKTMGFSVLKINHNDDGAILFASSPAQGSVEIELTPDELMLFLVEVGNGLKDARSIELNKKIRKDLEKENRR